MITSSTLIVWLNNQLTTFHNETMLSVSTCHHKLQTSKCVSVLTESNRHRVSTSMYSLTFCVHVVARMPPVEAHSPGHRSNVENAPRRRSVTGQPAMPTSHIRRTILRTPPSTASHRPAVRAHPAKLLHYVVISRDGRKLVSRVRIMLP